MSIFRVMARALGNGVEQVGYVLHEAQAQRVGLQTLVSFMQRAGYSTDAGDSGKDDPDNPTVYDPKGASFRDKLPYRAPFDECMKHQNDSSDSYIFSTKGPWEKQREQERYMAKLSKAANEGGRDL